MSRLNFNPRRYLLFMNDFALLQSLEDTSEDTWRYLKILEDWYIAAFGLWFFFIAFDSPITVAKARLSCSWFISPISLQPCTRRMDPELQEIIWDICEIICAKDELLQYQEIHEHVINMSCIAPRTVWQIQAFLTCSITWRPASIGHPIDQIISDHIRSSYRLGLGATHLSRWSELLAEVSGTQHRFLHCRDKNPWKSWNSSEILTSQMSTAQERSIRGIFQPTSIKCHDSHDPCRV